MSSLHRHLAAAVGAVLAVSPGPASARSSLADAVGRWYRTDPAIACVSPDGRSSRCSSSDGPTTSVHLDPGGRAALVFLTWLPDPTGNAEETAAAVFRDGPDGWRLARRLPGLRTKPASKVAFQGGTAQFAVEVLKPGDARCCPTGRKPMRVDIR